LFVLIAAGHVITGDSLSTTVTVNEQLLEAPTASCTRYVTVSVPSPNAAPLALPAVRDVTAPAQLSSPTGAVYVVTLLHSPAEVVVTMFDGQLMVGA
jgi:hypothetical protein